MSAFGGLILTNNGRNLQAKAQLGTNLHFTRIALGDNDLGGTSILDLNSLKHEVKSLPIVKLKLLSGGKAVVGAVFSNQDMASGFYWREIGVFADDPENGEILYCYGNAGTNAEYIPAGGGADIIEKAIDVTAIVGNAQNVTAAIDQSLIFASQKDIESKVDKVSGKQLSTEDYTTQEKQKLASLSNYSHPSEHPATMIKMGDGSSVEEKVMTHLADNVKHITAAERTAWNAKVNQTDYMRAGGYGVTAGTSTAYTLTLNPAPVAYADGQQFIIKPHVDCGANPTLNVTGLGAGSILKQDGSAVAAGDIKANKPLSLVRVGSNFFIRNAGGGHIKSIQHGTSVMNSDVSFITVNINSINANNCVVIVSPAMPLSSNTNARLVMASADLITNTSFRLIRDYSGVSQAYNWEVIEFENVNTQYGYIIMNETENVVNITPVNLNKAMLFITFKISSAYGEMSDVLIESKLSSSQISFKASRASRCYTIEWRVIELK